MAQDFSLLIPGVTTHDGEIKVTAPFDGSPIAMVTAADEQSHLDLSAKAGGDSQRQPINGTPGYAILTLRGGIPVNDNLRLTAAIENVTNKDYRIHGSGQNEPGTNVILGIDIGF